MKTNSQSKLTLSLSTLKSVKSTMDLNSAVAGMRDMYEFAHLVFVVFRSSRGSPVSPIYSTTYPEEWTNFYIDRDYVSIDPVSRVWRTGLLPVDWSELDWSPPTARTFLREAKNFNIGRHGVTIPVRGPDGERSLLSATANASASDWRQLRMSTGNDLQIISAYLHEKIAAVSGLRKDSQRKLSKREQECLQLLAEGLVPKRIASHLRLSESAVRLYLGSARRKLDAGTIYEAIAKASFHEKVML